MAKQLIATAQTATHDFAIWVINPDFSPFPYTFTVANWNIEYRALDNNTPGFLPSVCTVNALINDDDFSLNLRTILQDADGRYMIKITEGINVVYVGFITPDLGEIELINGQRFIKLVASDGFQMLNETSSIYEFTGVKPFANQIYDILNFYDFWDVYDAFAVSTHPEPTQAVDTTKGGLYWTGCIQEGLYYKDTEWRNFRDILDDILLTYGLQCFQDKGLLVFRSVWYKTPTWYNFYGYQGAFLYRLTGYSTTDTADVYTDGTELFKVATRQVTITHNQPSSNIINLNGNFINRVNYFLGNAIPTGTNYLRYSADLKMRVGVPVGYFSHAYVEWNIYLQYGPYYWNGSNWTKTVSSITYEDNFQFTPDPVNPSIHDFEHSVNNVDTDSLPNIGSQPIYITVTGQQTAGDPLSNLGSTSTIDLRYHSGDPDKTIYYADNTKRRNAIDFTFDTEIGDIRQYNNIASAIAGEIRAFTNTGRTASMTSLSWDTGGNLLLTKGSIEFAKIAFKPQQYYEIELAKTVSYNHTYKWPNSITEYKPLNLSFDEKSTKATYREWVYGDILTDPNSGRPDQLLPPFE